MQKQNDKVCEPKHYNKLTSRLMTNQMIKKLRKPANQAYQIMTFQMKTFKLHVQQPACILQTNHHIPCPCCSLINAKSFHSHF
jgi:hypothetical protein